jgi:phosphoribosylamine---glycine ligase
MRVMIIGSGGREHAMAWKLAQSDKVKEIYCVPGNGGTALEAKCSNVQLASMEEMISFAKENSIDLTVVGPEEPLTKGIVDRFKAANLKIFGPSMQGAALEGSKIIAKDFMKKYGVKTAEYESFDNIQKALSYIKTCRYPSVIKADGLAAGKGVVICSDAFEAEKTLRDFMLEDIFNGAGQKVVIEEFLEGVEASILSITDGKTIIPFVSAKDHKQIFDGNEGPNTGGMGVIAPNPYCSTEVLELFKKDIMEPTLKGIAAEAMDFTGIIFFGIMINSRGVFLLEYNVRLGDPETQAVLTLMDSDFLHLITAALDGKLQNYEIKWKNSSACCVVAVSGGYPGDYKKGFEINIEESLKSKVFAAGAKLENGVLRTDGGRVLAVTSVGNTLEDAIERAYSDITKITFEKMYYRKDIGRSK